MYFCVLLRLRSLPLLPVVSLPFPPVRKRLTGQTRNNLLKSHRNLVRSFNIKFRVYFLGSWFGYALICILRVLFGIESSDLAIGLAMMVAKMGGWNNTVIFIFLNSDVRFTTILLELGKRRKFRDFGY